MKPGYQLKSTCCKVKFCFYVLIALVCILMLIYYIRSTYGQKQVLMKKAHIQDDQRYMSVLNDKHWGRGNELFSFAAMLGIISHNNHRWLPCLKEDIGIRKMFELSGVPICDLTKFETIARNKTARFSETAYGFYDWRSEHLPDAQYMILSGYFQSWKYFENVKARVHEYLQFQPEILTTAQDRLRLSVEEHFKCTNCVAEKVLIGIHVRRGDYMSDKAIVQLGYTIAPAEYLHRAMAYMIKEVYHMKPTDLQPKSSTTIPGSHNMHMTGSASSTATVKLNSTHTPSSALYHHDNVRSIEALQNHLFLVCSDDITWTKKIFSNRNDVVFFTPKQQNPGHVLSKGIDDSFVDLAVLSLCNHTIMTVGSFGWWAGYLAGGTTVYYKNWPRYNSWLWNHTSHDDYFPPSWIGLK